MDDVVRQTSHKNTNDVGKLINDEIRIFFAGPIAQKISQSLRQKLQQQRRQRKFVDSISISNLSEFVFERHLSSSSSTNNNENNDNCNLLFVFIVETIEDDELSEDAHGFVRELMKFIKNKEAKTDYYDEEKNEKNARAYVMIGVGDSNIIADRQCFRSNQNSAEDCNKGVQYVEKMIDRCGNRWRRKFKRIELDYAREWEDRLEKFLVGKF